MIHPSFKGLKFGDEWEGLDSLAAPLGLMYIATPLINSGYDVKFIDFNVDRLTKEKFFNEISEAKYLLLSCYSDSLKSVYEIIKIARKINKDIFIMCGGPYCKLTGNYVAGSDLTVIGEAEEIIVDLFDRLNKKDSLSNIPGLIYKKGDKIIRNKGCLEAKDINRSIGSSHILTKDKNYGMFFGYRVKGLIGTMTSRGCPYNCNFCTHKGSINNKIVRKRTVDNVIAELKDLEKNGTRYVIFYDDNFLIDKKRVNSIMDRIIQEKIKLKLIVQGRVDSADYNFYKKLYRAGVIMIAFGIENANQDVLDYYNKGTSVEQIRKAIEIADKVGIITMGFFMIGSPIEDKKHFQINKKFINNIPLDVIHISILEYLEGSNLWEKAVKEGKISKNETSVVSNEKLSKYSYKEWIDMRDDLLDGFYKKPKRILRGTYKVLKRGFLIEFIKILWVGRKGFVKKSKNAFFVEAPDSKIEVLTK